MASAIERSCDVDLTELSEEDLLRQVERGQDGAFEYLYRRFYPRLVRAVGAAAGDSAIAEDVAQEAMLRVRDRLETFDYSRSFWPWLKTVALHIATDTRRKSRREVLVEVDKPSNCAAIKSCEESIVLIQALKGIPRRQRIAIVLRYIEERDPHDAARRLGLSRSAFDQLLFRARRRLREGLSEAD